MLANLTPLAWLVAYPLQLISHYILSMMQTLAQFPRALVKINLATWQITVWVVLLGLMIAWMSYKNWRWQRLKTWHKIARLTAQSANRPKM